MLPPELFSSQLDRFHQLCYLPQSVRVEVFHEDRAAAIVAPKRHFAELSRRLKRLKETAWIVMGISQISLLCSDQVICVAELKDTVPTKEYPMVATTTRPTTNLSSEAQTVAVIPTVKSLAAIARNAGVTEEAIAAEIVSSGGLAFYDADASTYKADEAGINAWADAWLDRDREARKAQLFSIATNGKVTPPDSEIAADHAPAKNRKPRLKDFQVSKSYPKTIGNFLEAQKWDAQKRAEVIEQIANLPDEQSDSESLPEIYLSKVLNKYPANERSDRRKAIIKAVKKDMLGKPEAVAESAIEVA
jgi:hypothetical protein